MDRKLITDLVASRLHKLAALVAKHGAMHYHRRFGLTLLEWRAVAMLGGYSPLALMDLARMAGLDRGHASRTVAGLISRGLIENQKCEKDGRKSVLTLTAEGTQLYKSAFAESVNRNEKLLNTLTMDQRLQLDHLIGILTLNARNMVDDERRIVAGEIEESDVEAQYTDQPEDDTPTAQKLHRVRQLVDELSSIVRD